MIEDHSWELTSEQKAFLKERHTAIYLAYDNDNMGYLDVIENSDEYRSLFGNMSFDEAIDRYEGMADETAKGKHISLSEAQVRARKIYANLQERTKAARLAEAEYWKFLDDDDL